MTRNHTLNLPTTIGPQKARIAATEYRRLVQDLGTEQVKLAQLEDARRAAEEADRRALAESIRAGKPDPGTKAIDEANAQILATRRRVEALQEAVAASQRDLINTVRTVEPTWRAGLQRDLDARREALRGAVENVRGAHRALAETIATASWLSVFVEEPERAAYRPGKHIGVLPGQIGANGELQAVEAILADLAALADPPKSTPGPPPVQPLRQVA